MTTQNIQPSPAHAGVAGAQERPRELTANDFALMTGDSTTKDVTSTAAASPTMTPPSAGLTSTAVGAVSGQKVTALWSNAANGNAYIYLATAGWKHLSNSSDNGSSNLTQLAGSARETGAAPYVVDDAAGMVTALYVW